jgi:hypothetical protein
MSKKSQPGNLAQNPRASFCLPVLMRSFVFSVVSSSSKPGSPAAISSSTAAARPPSISPASASCRTASAATCSYLQEEQEILDPALTGVMPA